MNDKKLLVVIDMQNDFISGALANYAGAAVRDAVIKKLESWDGALLFTQDTHGEDYFSTQEGKKLPVKHCVIGTEGWKLDAGIVEASKKTCRENGARFLGVVKKPTFGALDILAKADALGGGWDEIEVCGLVSSICVISNALLLKAKWPEAVMRVDASCTAGLDDEDTKAALQVMRDCQIEVI